MSLRTLRIRRPDFGPEATRDFSIVQTCLGQLLLWEDADDGSCPPIAPAGFNVRINKTVSVDVFELPGRKALQEVINSLAWIIYS